MINKLKLFYFFPKMTKPYFENSNAKILILENQFYLLYKSSTGVFLLNYKLSDKIFFMQMQSNMPNMQNYYNVLIYEKSNFLNLILVKILILRKNLILLKT